MSNYFTPATVLVTLVKEGDFLVLASSVDGSAAGSVLKRESFLGTDVVEGGSSRVLGDTTTHACFATYPGVEHVFLSSHSGRRATRHSHAAG